MNDPARQTLYVLQVIVHPDYNPRGQDSDVALFHLDRRLTLNSYVHPICLPRWEVPSNINCVVTGWGKTQGEYRLPVHRIYRDVIFILISDLFFLRPSKPHTARTCNITIHSTSVTDRQTDGMRVVRIVAQCKHVMQKLQQCQVQQARAYQIDIDLFCSSKNLLKTQTLPEFTG